MEFSNKTKVEALNQAGWRCECCGRTKKEVGVLEIHHILPIAIALKFYPEISHACISSLANAKVLCKECHLRADEESKLNHEYHALVLYEAWLTECNRQNHLPQQTPMWATV